MLRSFDVMNQFKSLPVQIRPLQGSTARKSPKSRLGVTVAGRDPGIPHIDSVQTMELLQPILGCGVNCFDWPRLHHPPLWINCYRSEFAIPGSSNAKYFVCLGCLENSRTIKKGFDPKRLLSWFCCASMLWDPNEDLDIGLLFNLWNPHMGPSNDTLCTLWNDNYMEQYYKL